MSSSVLTPKTVSELVKIVAKKGKNAVLASGVDPGDRPVPGKVTIDLTHIAGTERDFDAKRPGYHRYLASTSADSHERLQVKTA